MPKGPLLKQLKDGEDIILDDGRIVYSKDVTGEPQKGFTVSNSRRYQLLYRGNCTFANEADILVHEATFDVSTGDLAKEYGHSTIGDAARTAKEAMSKLSLQIILVHDLCHLILFDLRNKEARFFLMFILQKTLPFEWKNEKLVTK